MALLFGSVIFFIYICSIIINQLKNTPMKNTITMLSVIVTLLMTWMLIALIGFLLSDATYKECMINGGTLMVMTIFGWVPSVIVGADITSYLQKN
jgi:hypothetical protein